jgi:hypothetical protein
MQKRKDKKAKLDRIMNKRKFFCKLCEKTPFLIALITNKYYTETAGSAGTVFSVKGLGRTAGRHGIVKRMGM